MKPAILIALLAVAQSATADTVKLEPGPFEFPTRLGPLTYEGPPHRYDQPELGVSYKFSAPGMTLDIYVYDGGHKDIPDGAESAALCGEFTGLEHMLLQYPDYRNSKLDIEQMALLAPPSTDLLVREAALEFEFKGRPARSYLWMTGGAGNFVKLRFTAVDAAREETPEARRAILAALGAALRPHVNPEPPRAPPSGKKEITINISSGASSSDMQFSMMYAGALAAKLDEGGPDAMPRCAGPIVPTYEQELAALQTALAVSGGTKLGKKLIEAQKAGFLEEAVWAVRHRDEWGDTAPEGVDLAAFQPWARKHLKRFQYTDVGGVVAGAGRPLPIETIAP